MERCKKPLGVIDACIDAHLYFYRTSAGYFQRYHQGTAPPIPGSRRGKMQLTHIRSLGEMRAKSVLLCYSTFGESSHPKHIAIGP